MQDVYRNMGEVEFKQNSDFFELAYKRLTEYIKRLEQTTKRSWTNKGDIYRTDGGGHSILSEMWYRAVLITTNEPIIQRRIMFNRAGYWNRTQPDRNLTTGEVFDHTNKIWRKPKIINNPIFGNRMRILE
jgi:uncharacterized phosphosugar-binding protein